MESRRSVHYHRNTVIGPMPGEKNRRRRMARLKSGLVELQAVPFEPKLVANSECVFCGSRFGGRYLTICLNCKCCQYCGLVAQRGQVCVFCGNTPDEQTKRPKPNRKRATQGLSKPRKNKRRSVRRVGPQSIDRRANGFI